MSGGNLIVKPKLDRVTLVCVDTTDKVGLAERALEQSLQQCDFGAVKLLTHEDWRRHAVKIDRVEGMAGYSNFCIRELHKHVATSHALVCQWDGYVLNGQAWLDGFCDFDYIGAPWEQWQLVGNGGFSLRSKRLLELTARLAPGEPAHPEDSWICQRHRATLERQGMKFAPLPMARAFAFEGRGYNGREWFGTVQGHRGQFGFHSFLSPLPGQTDRPLVFHHSGDLGDLIYSLAVVRAMGGGTMFLSPDCKYPFPKPPRNSETDSVAFCHNAAPLLMAQDYLWGCQPTAATPYSTDVDFNFFRSAYQQRTAANWDSLLELHARPFGVPVDPGEAWLTVPSPVFVPGRPIVVNRTPRYHNDAFPWWQLVRKYGHLMVFVGDGNEAQTFQGFGAPDLTIPFHPTANLLHLAQVIAGAKVFIGNQSSAMAIALGLGVPVVQEVWRGNANCKLKRDRAIYWEGGQDITIPEEWLA